MIPLCFDSSLLIYIYLCFSICSEQEEDVYLPTFDCMLPCVVELKIVPNSTVLVIGHNGCGEFGIWYVFPFERFLISPYFVLTACFMLARHNCMLCPLCCCLSVCSWFFCKAIADFKIELAC